jgi:hypothetical protein
VEVLEEGLAQEVELEEKDSALVQEKDSALALVLEAWGCHNQRCSDKR